MKKFTGMYIIIFGLSLNILWHRRGSSASKAYARWIIILFILVTIFNATMAWIEIDQTLITFNAVKTDNYIPFFKTLSQARSSEWAARLGLNWFAANLSSYLFDYLMVYRCYVVWGFSKRILYPFAFVVLVTDTMGFALAAVRTLAYHNQNSALSVTTLNIANTLVIITIIYDSLLTLLTAGRIWWTIRQVDQITGDRVYTRYKVFVATILESGFIYSGTLVVSTALPWIMDPESKGFAPFDFSVLAVQMTGIAQTVVVIRIAYGQAVESVQQMVSTLHFAEGRNTSMAAHGTINLQQSLADVEERGNMGRIETDKLPANVAGEEGD
ncbi:hypothetical protein PM082_004532 [Marasmius tenuissimus]|nr:hypothetical protein PM082_004532 [Marasmius tenuissimus]